MITETDKQNIIKSILNVRCREGSTIADIEGKCSWNAFISVHTEFDGYFFQHLKDDYEEVTGDRLLDARTYLNTIDSVYCDVYSNGQPKWYVKSDNTLHLTKMILEQRPIQHHQHYFQAQKPQLQPKPQHLFDDTINLNDCFFKDNIIYKLR